MIAMTRYQLALLGHSQRFLPPALAFAGVLALLFNEASAPVPPEFAVAAGALAVATCWLTIALVDAEDPVQRLVLLTHVRRPSTALGGLVLAVLTCAGALIALTVVWAELTHGGVAPGQLGLGVLAQFACACTGIAIGLPCSRLLVGRFGWTMVSAIFVLALVLLLRWIPLVNPMLRALVRGGDVTAPVLLGTALSLCALAISFFVVGTVSRRRS